MENFETILYEEADAVATITFNRPKAFNAFTAEMKKEITQALKMAERDAEVRAIVLTGAGKAFCAGQDIKSVEPSTNYGDLLREHYHPMVRALDAVSKPVIAAVNGVAAGAGMSLALAADFRLMKPESRLVSAFLGIGLVPDAGFMYILPRLVGYAKALEIAALDKPISGEEAVELGLATECIAAEEWEAGVQKFSQKCAAMPTTAFSLVKRYMMDGMHEEFAVFLEQEAQAQRIAGLTEDHQEGLRAFQEKRKPKFLGK